METLSEAESCLREAKIGWARGGFLGANVFSSGQFSFTGTGMGRARKGLGPAPVFMGEGVKKGGMRWLNIVTGKQIGRAHV